MSSFARYVKSMAQTNIASGAGTAVRFDLAQSMSPDVTPNGAKNQFTLNKAGIWSVEAAVRIVGASAASDTWEGLCCIGPTAGNTNDRYTAQNGFANAKTATLCHSLAVVRAYTAGDTIAVNCFTMCFNGGSFSFTAFDEQVHLSFLYIGPS